MLKTELRGLKTHDFSDSKGPEVTGTSRLWPPLELEASIWVFFSPENLKVASHVFGFSFESLRDRWKRWGAVQTHLLDQRHGLLIYGGRDAVNLLFRWA